MKQISIILITLLLMSCGTNEGNGDNSGNKKRKTDQTGQEQC